MKYSNFIFIGLGIVLLIFSIALDEENEEEQWKWRPSYSSLDTRPFGNKALYERFGDLFPEQKISTVRKSLYEILTESGQTGFNYLFINEKFNPLQFDAASLLTYVREGGHVFVAAQRFEGAFADSLQLSTASQSNEENVLDSMQIHFTSPRLTQSESFSFMPGTAQHYFSKFKSGAVLARNQHNKAVLLRLPLGKGFFYLSSTPLAYTNYHLLWQADNQDFIEGTFAYLPQQDIYWDEYYKVGREESKNIFRFLLSRRSLRAALYLGLFTMLLLLIFESKRKQRIIPVVEPLRNDTVDFVGVVGQMHYQSKNHLKIAQKKVRLFREYLRQQYFVHDASPSKEILNRLASKSNHTPEDISRLFEMMSDTEKSKYIKEEQLKALSKLMHQFKSGQKV